MQYLAAFIIIMSLGLGVNYLMLHFIKNRLKPKDKIETEDDPLSGQMKEEINIQVEELKKAVKDLLGDIELKSESLDRREAQLNDLIKLADQRIKELSEFKDKPGDDLDWEAIKSNKQQDFRKVYELHQQGLCAKDIARNLKIGVGEVELKLGILNKVR